MRRASRPDAWSEGTQRLFAPENWKHYAAGVAAEIAYAAALIAVAFACAVVAELILR